MVQRRLSLLAAITDTDIGETPSGSPQQCRAMAISTSAPFVDTLMIAAAISDSDGPQSFLAVAPVPPMNLQARRPPEHQKRQMQNRVSGQQATISLD